MNEISFPTQSNATIIKASILALAVASIIFITIILPAEYNIDPTGIGKYLGLTRLNEQTMVDATSEDSQDAKSGYKENSITVIVPPNKGIEYKFKIKQYGKISYEWETNGEQLYFDFHGEPKGDTTGYFESYTIATASEMKGSMTVPFEGSHGWYWKNYSQREVTITLKTQGQYEIVGLMQ